MNKAYDTKGRMRIAAADENDDRFELTMLNLADPYGKVPLAKLFIRDT
jgi:hypothetical protein